MSNFVIHRDKNRCVLCMECLHVCPQSQPGAAYPVIVPGSDSSSPPIIANPDNCIQCLICFDTCRAMAITLEGYHRIERLVQNEYVAKAAKMI